jgi:hypothetical protein
MYLLAEAQKVPEVDIEADSALKWAHNLYLELVEGQEDWIENSDSKNGTSFTFFQQSERKAIKIA